MTYGASFPPGFWANNNGQWQPTYFNYADVFAMNGVPVMAHEPAYLTGINNFNDVFDPTSYGDRSLTNRSIVMNMDIMMDYAGLMVNPAQNLYNNPGQFIA